MTQVSNLDERVRESLREKIISGELGGGFHLSELKISKEYNVSRTPVREALCALAADGLVEMVPHRGAFVTDTPQDTRSDQLQAYGLFMGLTAKLATENGNIELLMDFETAISSLVDASKRDEATFLDALKNVNSMLQQACASQTVVDALEMVSKRTSTQQIWETAYMYRSELAQQYSLLLGAMKHRKPDNAEATMRQIMTLLTAPLVAKDQQTQPLQPAN
jgi:DNA-binding GntR family transcriptional regulator